MSIFESTVNINKPASEVYRFLADFNNHRELMPEGISDWSSDNDSALFTFQGMARLSMKISDRQENQSVLIVPNQQVPFPIQMEWNLSAEGAGTRVHLKLSAELNMMMKMMASAPLNKLVNAQTEKLQGLLK